MQREHAFPPAATCLEHWWASGPVPNSPSMSPGSPADLAMGAFSDAAPWDLTGKPLPWRTGIDAPGGDGGPGPAVAAARRLPPGRRVLVTTPGSGGPSLCGAWSRSAGPTDLGRREISRAGLSRRLRKAFERLGPTYIKLGQILSSGEGVFPPELVGEFRLLRDQVPAETFEVVREVVEADLGRPLDEVFEHFETTPIAAASIAQVHAARLRTRRGGRGEGAAPAGRRPRAERHRRHELAGALPDRADPGGHPGQPAGPGRAVRRDDRRGARLPPRGRQHARHRPRPGRDEPAVRGRAPPSPRAGDPPGAGHGTALDGFCWDDVAGMRRAGIDTSAVVRALLIAFLEGATLFGVFHGDLHGGNLFVQPDGRVALLDYGITGRLDEVRRVAFLRLLMGGTLNDQRLQLAALRDLGAVPPDTDLDALAIDLGIDKPVVDPTTLAPEELLAEIRDLTKRLLEYGARFPKILMLFVKDLLFIDGSLATLAPDVDLFGEVTAIATYFTNRYGERIAHDIGIDPREHPVDIAGVRAASGWATRWRRLTYRDLQARRELIRRRMEEHHRRSENPRGWSGAPPARRAAVGLDSRVPGPLGDRLRPLTRPTRSAAHQAAAPRWPNQPGKSSRSCEWR